MTQPDSYDARYERRPDVYEFATHDGIPVHAVALPTWEETEAALAQATPLRGYVLTTELITSPYPLEEIPRHLDQVEQRVDRTVELSRLHPEATILLGTVTTDASGTLRNSLAIIRNGEVTGHTDKRGVMWPDEAAIFMGTRREQASLGVGRTALICSDLITAAADGRHAAHPSDGHALLLDDTQTLLVSSCWAVPRFRGLFTPDSDDERYRRALERTISELFAGHPNLREVIMADRAIPDSPVAPYTAVFRRR